MDDTRRTVLRVSGVAVAAGLAGCSGSGFGTEGEDETDDGSMDGTDDGSMDGSETEGAMDEPVSVTIDNVGSTAYRVTADSSGSVAPTGEDNPTMTFSVGTRYEIENGGWSAHPFALRAADDEPLLSQDADGSFEGDSEVNWTDDGGTLAFTVTQELADELDYYICTVHSAMRGSVETA